MNNKTDDSPHSAEYLMVNQMMDRVFLKYRIETMNRELRAMENDSNITMNHFFKQKKPRIQTNTDAIYKENGNTKIHHKIILSETAVKQQPIGQTRTYDYSTPCGSGYTAVKHLR